MSKLLSVYASACGLQIGEVDIKEQFYPISFPKYITIQTGSGQGPKNYDLWQEVIVLLKPILDANQITPIHLGGKDDPQLQGVYDLRGKTTIQQSHYIIKRSMVHVGNDSWLAHCAGWNRVPLVALYGSTSVENHGPYWYDNERTIFISSHRNGGVPSYTSQEQPKTINLIPPEQVANAVLRLLGINTPFTHQTRMFGLLYNHSIFELIPNSFPAPSFLPEAPLIVRMDYLFNEDILLNVLKTGRKINLVTNKPVNLNTLAQFRNSILSYTHELDALCPLEYIGTMRGIIPHHSFFTKENDDAKVAALRYQFFDVCNIERANDLTKQDYIHASLSYLNWGEEKTVDIEKELSYNGKIKFKSNKYLLSDGKIYLSLAHLKRGISIEALGLNTGDVIDDPEYFKDINHHTIFYQP